PVRAAVSLSRATIWKSKGTALVDDRELVQLRAGEHVQAVPRRADGEAFDLCELHAVCGRLIGADVVARLVHLNDAPGGWIGDPDEAEPAIGEDLRWLAERLA